MFSIHKYLYECMLMEHDLYCGYCKTLGKQTDRLSFLLQNKDYYDHEFRQIGQDALEDIKFLRERGGLTKTKTRLLFEHDDINMMLSKGNFKLVNYNPPLSHSPLKFNIRYLDSTEDGRRYVLKGFHDTDALVNDSQTELQEGGLLRPSIQHAQSGGGGLLRPSIQHAQSGGDLLRRRSSLQAEGGGGLSRSGSSLQAEGSGGGVLSRSGSSLQAEGGGGLLRRRSSLQAEGGGEDLLRRIALRTESELSVKTHNVKRKVLLQHTSYRPVFHPDVIARLERLEIKLDNLETKMEMKGRLLPTITDLSLHVLEDYIVK